MPSRIGGAAAATTTVAIPGSYQAGDLIICYAFRDGSTTIPGPPTNGAWQSIMLERSFSTPTAAVGLWWRYAESSSESAPVVASATGVLLEVWRGSTPYGVQIGAVLSSVAQTSATITYPALTLSRTDGTSFILRLAGHRTATNLTTNTPAGYTAGAGVATEVRSCYLGPTSSNATADTQAVSSSSGYNAITLEVMEKQPVWMAAITGTYAPAVTVGTAPAVDFTTDAPGWVPQEGDMVLLCLRAASGMALGGVPAGWVNTLGGTSILSTTGAQMVFAHHFVTSGEAAAATKSYTATGLLSSSGSRALVGIVLRGVDPTSAVDSFQGGTFASSTTHNVQGLTGSNLSDGSFVLGFIGNANSYAATSGQPIPTTGWAVLQDAFANSIVMRGDLTTAGVNIANASRTVSTAAAYASITFAFNQAPPAPAVVSNLFFSMF